MDMGGLTLNVASTSNIVEDGSLVHGSVSNVDPQLGALTLNGDFLVHALQAGSPAIDAASADATTINDQLGALRGLCFPDIGAVEKAGGASLVFSAPTEVTNTWIGCTNTDWNIASNWSKNAVPTANDIIYVPVAAQNQLIINQTVTCAKMFVQIGATCKIDYNAGGKLLIKF